MLLSKDLKGLAAFLDQSEMRQNEHRGTRPVNTEAPHYREAGAVEDGKILITPRNDNIPGNLQVRQSNRFDYGYNQKIFVINILETYTPPSDPPLSSTSSARTGKSLC